MEVATGKWYDDLEQDRNGDYIILNHDHVASAVVDTDTGTLYTFSSR